MGKPELLEPAREIFNEVMDSGFVAQFDAGGSIGRRYRRQDEVGTPFCVTVDYTTIEDGTVTVRDRDSMKQVRVHRNKLIEDLTGLVHESLQFEKM